MRLMRRRGQRTAGSKWQRKSDVKATRWAAAIQGQSTKDILIVVLAIYVESDRNELLASERETSPFVSSVQTRYGPQYYSEAKC